MNIETLHSKSSSYLGSESDVTTGNHYKCLDYSHKGGLIVDQPHTQITPNKSYSTTFSLFQPSAIFLTHHHHDHIGAAQRIRDSFGIPIIAHKLTAELVPFNIDQEVNEGDQFNTGEDVWTAFHTPGHAPGHLCLLAESDRSVIAGDMVAGEGTILINPSEGSIREYIHSLEKLKTLTPSRLLPAHGSALNNAETVLQDYISHRCQRILQIWESPHRHTTNHIATRQTNLYRTTECLLGNGCHSSSLWTAVFTRRLRCSRNRLTLSWTIRLLHHNIGL